MDCLKKTCTVPAAVNNVIQFYVTNYHKYRTNLAALRPDKPQFVALR